MKPPPPQPNSTSGHCLISRQIGQMALKLRARGTAIWEIKRPATKVSSSQVIAYRSVKGCRYGSDDSEVREGTSETVYLVARHLVVMDQHRRICELPERL